MIGGRLIKLAGAASVGASAFPVAENGSSTADRGLMKGVLLFQQRVIF